MLRKESTKIAKSLRVSVMLIGICSIAACVLIGLPSTSPESAEASHTMAINHTIRKMEAQIAKLQRQVAQPRPLIRANRIEIVDRDGNNVASIDSGREGNGPNRAEFNFPGGAAFGSQGIIKIQNKEFSRN